MNGWWWNWNDESGQNGHVLPSAVETFGSLHVGPKPFVQPGPPMLPAALSQPPAYQAQLTPASLIRSPMFRSTVRSSVGGSTRAEAALRLPRRLERVDRPVAAGQAGPRRGEPAGLGDGAVDDGARGFSSG